MTHAQHLYFDSERMTFRPLDLEDLDLGIELWTDPEVVRYVDDGVSTVEEIKIVFQRKSVELVPMGVSASGF